MLSLFLFPQEEAATDTTGNPDPGFSSHATKIHPKLWGCCQNKQRISHSLYSYGQNIKSYWTPQSMAHLLTTRMPKFLPLLLEASSLQDPLGSFSPGQSLLRCLCPDKPLPPFPPNSLCFLFSTACTTISECAGHVFFLFLLLEHTPLEGRDGVFLSSQCTA